MSYLDAVINKVLGIVDKRLEDQAPFRAIVVSVSVGKVKIRRLEAGGVANDELYARVVGFALAVDDEVLCIPVGSGRKYVVLGKLQRAAPTGFTLEGPWTSIDINGGTIDDVTITNPVIADADITTPIRTIGTAPTITKLTAGGTTGTVSIVGGNDICGVCQITPGGTGIAAGAVFTINFAVAKPNGNYAVLLTPGSASARTFGNNLGASSRTTTAVEISVATALGTGNNYQWHYLILPY